MEMISFENAIEIIKANGSLLGTETVDIQAGLNRVLRQDVASDMDMPPFDKSAMDGYVCRRQDLASTLDVIEVIPAGYQPRLALGANQCAKIMTGAVLPAGADCVIIVEEVEQVSENKIRFRAARTAPHICRKGEDVVAGQILVRSGTRLMPKEIAALALAGCVNPVVSRIPRIGIIATGDEIIEPYGVPKGSEIRNSNSYQLYAQCLEFGCSPRYYGITVDTREAIGKAINTAKRENDVVLLTGGVSMGDFDLVPGILKEQGFETLFDKVAIQPGKPTVFGRAGNQYVFGLPGNPVSSYTIFELFVKELLSAMMGTGRFFRSAMYPLGKPVRRRATVRRAWIPVWITTEGMAEPVEYHGSAHITSLASADGLISLPVGVSAIEQRAVVEVRLIS